MRDAGENENTPDIAAEAAYAKQDKSWPMNSTCAGRIYLAPESKQPPDATQLFINFGYAQNGMQKVPEWIDALSPVCSKEQYGETMGKLVDFARAHKATSTCCLFGGSDDGLMPELTKILDGSGWGGASPPTLISKDGQAELVGAPAYDQTGEPFTQDLAYRKYKGFKKSSIWSYRTAPAWEPTGLNIVVTLAGKDAQAQWPKTPQLDGGVQMMLVTCPPDVVPGQTIMAAAPNGVSFQVQVPPGVAPGAQFQVGLPAQPMVPAPVAIQVSR